MHDESPKGLLTRALAAIWAILDAVIGRAPASRDLADDAIALRIIATPGRLSTIPQRRLAAAFLRLLQSGSVVRVDGSYYLTERGWEDIGRPLSARELRALQRLRDEREGWFPPRDDADLLRQRGLLPRPDVLGCHRWKLTPAGRAACRGALS